MLPEMRSPARRVADRRQEDDTGGISLGGNLEASCGSVTHERWRNNRIEKLESIRNRFIDDRALADQLQ
jgi:hypothetical protein